MDEPWGYDIKWSKSEKGEYYVFTYMWNLQSKINKKSKPNRSRLINTENRQLVTMWRGGMGEVGEGERGTNFKL